MSEEALAIMASDLDSLQELEAVDLSGEFYNKGLSQILGTEKAGQLQADLGLYGASRTGLFPVLFPAETQLGSGDTFLSIRG